MGLSTFIFFFFLFFSATFVRAISLEPLLAETPNSVIQCAAWSCGLILHCCLPSNSLYLFFFFFAKILSGPYLWNRYSQRLQIECAAWSYGLILHCCLPSNSLSYYYFFFFFFPPRFCHNFIRAILWNRYSQRLQIECAAWSCGVIVHYCLPSSSLRYLFIYFFSATILSGLYLWNRYSQRLQTECAI